MTALQIIGVIGSLIFAAFAVSIAWLWIIERSDARRLGRSARGHHEQLDITEAQRRSES